MDVTDFLFRAVKFIRDQAKAALSTERVGGEDSDHHSIDTAHVAAAALRRLLKVDTNKSSSEISLAAQPAPSLDEINPLRGWSEGVTLRKSHCCLLLNPQFVLRGDNDDDKACIVAGILAKVQSYGIMDNANRDDPVSGKIMSR